MRAHLESRAHLRRRCVRPVGLAALALALAAAIPGCGGGPNDLWGSVGEVYDLSFDSVRGLEIGDYLVVEYYQGQGKVVKLSVNLAGLTVVPDQEIDLNQVVDAVPRGSLQRIVDSTVDFPMEHGTLTLSGAPEPGAGLSGGFRALLSDPDGRTLNGDFEITLEGAQ